MEVLVQAEVTVLPQHSARPIVLNSAGPKLLPGFTPRNYFEDAIEPRFQR